MKLYGVTTTYNNEPFVPFVMQYAKELGYDKLIVYDNGSTDNTVEMLKKWPFVEVRQYDTDKFSEENKQKVLLEGFWDLYSMHTKNTGDGYVKGETEIAWVTITDFDEVVFFTRSDYMIPKRYLEKITVEQNYNVVNEQIVNISSNLCFPGKLCHQYADRCTYGDAFEWRKPLLFRMDNIRQFGPSYGLHFAQFSFFDEDVKALSGTRTINFFHLKYALGKEIYLRNKQNLVDREYYSDSDIVKPMDTFQLCRENSIDINRYFEHKMLFGVEPGEKNSAMSF